MMDGNTNKPVFLENSVPFIEKNHVYIHNFTEELYNLFKVGKEKHDDITDSEVFWAIFKYLRYCLRDVGVHPPETYLVFVTPNEWALEPDIINLMMRSLLEGFEIYLHTATRDNTRILLVTELEATLSYYQLGAKTRNTIPPFIGIENRCVIYRLFTKSNAIIIESMYFQMKEDYNLRLFDEKYYKPNVLSIVNPINVGSINFMNIIDTLKEIIFNELLDPEDSIDTPTDFDDFTNAVNQILLYALEDCITVSMR